MNTIRLPFLWERMQKTLNGELETSELNRMDTFVTYVTNKGGYLILDPHNYARYRDAVIGQSGSGKYKIFGGKENSKIKVLTGK